MWTCYDLNVTGGIGWKEEGSVNRNWSSTQSVEDDTGMNLSHNSNWQDGGCSFKEGTSEIDRGCVWGYTRLGVGNTTMKGLNFKLPSRNTKGWTSVQTEWVKHYNRPF